MAGVDAIKPLISKVIYQNKCLEIIMSDLDKIKAMQIQYCIISSKNISRIPNQTRIFIFVFLRQSHHI